MTGGDDLLDVGGDDAFLEDDGFLLDAEEDDAPLLVRSATADILTAQGGNSLLVGSVFAWSRQR